jgi:hypothetical protein
MSVDYLSSISDFNLDDYTAGADVSSPLPDVSNGWAPMTTSTPTGNGSGQFLDTSMQNAIFGGLSKVLDYAIKRDQYNMGMALPGMQATNSQQVLAVQKKQTNFLFLAMCGLGIFLVARA